MNVSIFFHAQFDPIGARCDEKDGIWLIIDFFAAK
jgi:hypothetical protein